MCMGCRAAHARLRISARPALMRWAPQQGDALHTFPFCILSGNQKAGSPNSQAKKAGPAAAALYLPTNPKAKPNWQPLPAAPRMSSRPCSPSNASAGMHAPGKLAASKTSWARARAPKLGLLAPQGPAPSARASTPLKRRLLRRHLRLQAALVSTPVGGRQSHQHVAALRHGRPRRSGPPSTPAPEGGLAQHRPHSSPQRRRSRAAPSAARLMLAPT